MKLKSQTALYASKRDLNGEHPNSNTTLRTQAAPARPAADSEEAVGTWLKPKHGPGRGPRRRGAKPHFSVASLACRLASESPLAARLWQSVPVTVHGTARWHWQSVVLRARDDGDRDTQWRTVRRLRLRR